MNENEKPRETRYEYIRGTPFTIIKRPEVKQWEITIGLNIASPKKFRTKLGAKMYIKSKPWILIYTMSKITNNTKEK